MTECLTRAESTPAFNDWNKSPWARAVNSTADAFGRHERIPSTLTAGRAIPLTTIEFKVGQRTIRYSYLGGHRLPEWVKPVFEYLVSRWGVEAGWDGYRAVPTNSGLVAELLNCLQVAMPDHAKEPIVTPLADGGVQAEWHSGDTSLEIVVQADEPPRFYFCDSATASDREGPFDSSVETIRSLIAKF